jgi:hypothetical protein
MALIATSGILIACQKDARNPSVTSASDAEACCVGSYPETMSTLFSCGNAASGFLTIVGQNDANSLTFTINRTGNLNKNIANRFTRVEYTISNGDDVVASGSTEQSDNAPKTTYSFSYTVPEEGVLASCAQYTVEVVIKGLEGFNALPINCANEWSGDGQGVFAKTFTYTVKTICENTPPTCTPRTQTQGYYGSSKTSAGSKFLTANFSKTGGSVTIGSTCGGIGTNTATFTSAQAVNDHLRKFATGNVLMLPKASTFSAQVLTLTLNTIFFPSLGSMLVKKEGSPFNGMTVSQVLDIANSALSGCAGALSFTGTDGVAYNVTLSQVNNIVDAINNSYTDGKLQLGNVLECPE